MPCLLEHIVQLTLHLLPDSVSVRLDYHTSAHSRLLCQIGLHHQLVVPLRIILTTFGKVFQFYCHSISFFKVFVDFSKQSAKVQILKEIYLKNK